MGRRGGGGARKGGGDGGMRKGGRVWETRKGRDRGGSEKERGKVWGREGEFYSRT